MAGKRGRSWKALGMATLSGLATLTGLFPTSAFCLLFSIFIISLLVICNLFAIAHELANARLFFVICFFITPVHFSIAKTSHARFVAL
jgi:hypothetical protein